MDRNTIRYIFVLSLLILDYGQLTKGSSAGCRENPHICRENEYCDEGYFGWKCINKDESQDYSNDNVIEQRDLDDNGDYYNTPREKIPERSNTFSENGYDSSEPTFEDKTLIRSLPLAERNDNYPSDTRNAGPLKEAALPPILPGNWDKVGVRNDISGPVKSRESLRQDEVKEYPESSHQTFHEKISDEQISIEHIRKSPIHIHRDPNSIKTHLKGNEDEIQTPNENNDVVSKGKVMIKGEVKKAESNIDQGPDPEQTYDRIKDFFKSQQASSIVEVPNAVKREEAAKSYEKTFVKTDTTAKDEVNAEEDADLKVPLKSIKIDLDRTVTDSEALALMKVLEKALWINAPSPMFSLVKVDKSSIHIRTVKNDYSPENEEDIAKRINEDGSVKENIARQMGMDILNADPDTPSKYEAKTKHVVNKQPKYFLITLITVGCVTGVILSAVAVYLIMKRYNETKKFNPVTLPGQEAAADYQELCRQFRASQGWDAPPVKTTGLGAGDKDRAGKAPPYSWSEEPVVPNLDISTGHVVLAYMEDHLKNKDRLNKEWEALCTYEAEPNIAELGKQDKNVRKNRYSDVLPYDHNRVVLRETANATGSDYINASFITDHDPRNPAYIATQGTLAHTVSDFWQLVWEQGVVVIVNLTRLSDLGLPQCHRYWPEEGHETYHIYEVHLVSEHIWCDDYLVRSFYLKNLQTSETRTVTQFHFLSWPDLNVPTSPKPLLEFRRKVNKCFRGRSCPIVVHCSGGVGRTGCYILIDMVLNKMMRGAKEIDIAATVEHLRDQRPHMVKTKAQFEFALTAVAEEVNAILQALAK